MNLQELIPMLQVAIGPSILISGVGLLLLTMTNRLGRTIDRSRQLVPLVKSGTEQERHSSQAQIDILWHRAKLLRTAIFMAAIGAFFAALMMILVFVSELAHLHLIWPISITFLGSMVSVMGSLVWFLRDVNVSLHALAIETARQ
jgi:Protein of unknown function (DUF2721)